MVALVAAVVVPINGRVRDLDSSQACWLEVTLNGGKQAPIADVALAGSLNPRQNADTVLRSSHFPFIHSQVMGEFMPEGFVDDLGDVTLR